mgnify:CR=1 FL=1
MKKITRIPHHNKGFGLKKVLTKKKICLLCGNKFNSLWIGNRLCKRCLAYIERNDDGGI